MAASTLTPQELRNFAGRIQGQLPSLPTAPAQTAIGSLNALAVAMEGAGDGPGYPPPILPPIVKLHVRNYSDPAPHAMGRPFGQAIAGDVRMYAGNKEILGEIVELNVRCLRFVAPANMRGTLLLSPAAAGQVTCISEYQGDFRGLLPRSRVHGGNVQLSWTTIPGDNTGCQLVSGRTYYINLGKFRLADFVNSGEFRPIISAHGNSISGCSQGMPNCGIDFLLSSRAAVPG